MPYRSRNLKGGAAQKVAAKLIAAGLVKEIARRRERRSGGATSRRQSYALRLTAAGAKAIAIDESPASHEAEDGNERKQAAGAEARVAHAPPDIPPADAAPSLSAPRAGTKLAKVIGLLQRDSGATLDELVASTGWLPHTTRAALTGLRKRGYAVAIDRSDKQRGSTYRVRMDGPMLAEQKRREKIRLNSMSRRPLNRKRPGGWVRCAPLGRRDGQPAKVRRRPERVRLCRRRRQLKLRSWTR